jgi:hypothetical protein
LNNNKVKKQSIMRITEERMGQLLPQNILDSELSLASKKVLAAMLDWYQNSEAKQTKIVIIQNKKLCSISGVGSDSLQTSLRELNDYGLVTRTIGTKLGDASKYVINFKKLLQPLKRMGFEEMFSEEIETSESLETPIRTIVKNSIVKNSIVKNSKEETSIEQLSTEQTREDKTSQVENSTDKTSTDKQTTVHTTESTFDIKDFMKEVDEVFVGKSEDELIQRKVEISKELESKRMQLGSSMINRCRSYLNRKYEQATVLI